MARSKERLDQLAGRIARDTGRNADTLAADLTSKAGLAEVEQVLRARTDITMLVNNAGVGATTPLLESDVEAMSQMRALNVDVPTRLTYAAVPGFAAHGSGTIINIASIVAIGPEILNGVYGGTKAFVLAFS